MKPDSHTVSVIVPTLGRESIRQCLDALERQTRPPDEVLVMEDTEKLGIGLTRNKGIAQAKGDLIAFTDDDCVPPDDWIENLLAIMDQYDADVVGGALVESDPFLNAINKRRQFPSVDQDDVHGAVGNTANIIYKHTVLENCLKQDGYIFPQHKYQGEDIDLIWRVRQNGARVVYSPNTVLHLRKSTPMLFLKRQFMRGISISLLYRSHRAAKESFIAQPSLLWGHGGQGRNADWWKVFWVKVIGPFDVASFQSFGDFFTFWLGEKIQGLGFLWGLIINERETR